MTTPKITRSITSFQNPKVRDSSQPATPVVTKSGKVLMLSPYCKPAQYHTDSLKVTFTVADESITPPKLLSKDILKDMIASDTKVTINIDQVYSLRNAKFTHFTDDNGNCCVIANYSAPYQGIAVSIPC